jgi:PKD repeat protein
LFADFIYKAIYTLVEDQDVGCRSCIPPTSPYRNETFFRIENSDPDEMRITDIFFAPLNGTQALYVIARGGEESVFRIRYTGNVDNAPPTPVLILPDQSGMFRVGEELQFDGITSSDPDGDSLTFFWEFGDGETSEEVSPTHSFTSPGEYTITLTVMDTIGQEQQTSDIIMIGVPPVVKILSPTDDEEFYVGEVLKLRGLAFDSTGNVLPEDQLTWEVRQHHANHFHPFLDPTVGNNIDLFGTPAPEDFFAATNSYLRIILSATDSYGLHTEVDLLVQPMKKNVTIATTPPGIEMVVENNAVITPREIVSWQGHQLNVLAKDVPPFEFRAWSDGDANRERKIEINMDNQQILAVFCAQDNWLCTSSEECCGGLCVDNYCQSVGTEQNNDFPSTSEDQHDGTDLDNTEEVTEEGNDDSKRSSLGRKVIALVVLFILFVIACPALFLYIRKKQRLNAGKSELPFSEAPIVRDSISTGGDLEELPMVVASNSGDKSQMTSADGTSVSQSRNINGNSDTGSSSSSEAASPENITDCDDTPQAISLEDGSGITENSGMLVDLESLMLENQIHEKGSYEELHA